MQVNELDTKELQRPKNYNGKKIEFAINKNGCHVCVSHKAGHQTYPMLCRNGKAMSMHRALFIDAYGPLEKGIVVRHKCDNTLCINLEHLEAGTQAENVRDMIERGRHYAGCQKGEKNAFSRLTEDNVRFILGYKGNQRELARLFGVSPATINDIKRGRTWAHLGPYVEPAALPERVLTPDNFEAEITKLQSVEIWQDGEYRSLLRFDDSYDRQRIHYVVHHGQALHQELRNYVWKDGE